MRIGMGPTRANAAGIGMGPTRANAAEIGMGPTRANAAGIGTGPTRAAAGLGRRVPLAFGGGLAAKARLWAIRLRTALRCTRVRPRAARVRHDSGVGWFPRQRAT